MKYITTIDGTVYECEILSDKLVSINGKTINVDFGSINGQIVYSLLIDGKSHEAYVYNEEENWQVLLRGRQYDVSVEDERERRLRSSNGGGTGSEEYVLKSPMPGLIVAVPVQEGDTVTKGQVLLVLESMKMQNELKSPRDGIVTRVKVTAGEKVDQKQVMLVVA